MTPLFGQRQLESLGIARDPIECGWLNQDVFESKYRINGKRSHLSALPDHLAMYAGIRWHVDRDVGKCASCACEASAIHERLATAIVDLSGARLRDPIGAGIDSLDAAEIDLASPADTPAGADRVDVHPDLSGGVENQCAALHDRSPS